MTSSTVSGSMEVNGIKFDYYEMKTSDAGGGPRGIRVNWERNAGGWVQYYSFDNNPHDNPRYNTREGPADFYRTACQRITQGVQRITSSEKFPPVKSGKPPTITGPAWSKMNKKQQDAKTKEYNDDQEKKQAKANKKAFDDGVATHLNNSRGRIFRWEDQDYILPHTER